MALKAWLKGRLYLAVANSGTGGEASPLGKAVDFSYNQGQASEEVRYAGASVTTVIDLLSNPQIQINFIRDTTENLVITAGRYWRDNGLGVKFYLYLDVTNEPTVYIYGYAAIEGLNLAGGAAAGIKGSFTLRPGPEAVWDDHFLIG